MKWRNIGRQDRKESKVNRLRLPVSKCAREDESKEGREGGREEWSDGKKE